MLPIRCKVILIHEEVGKHSEKITKLKPFPNKYNCEEITFPLEKDNWKKKLKKGT